MRMSMEMHERLLEEISNGVTLRDATKKLGIVVGHIYSDASENPDLQRRYDLARQNIAESLLDEIIAIADNEILDPQRARNMIDARKYWSAKQHPKKFGDRIDVNHNVEYVNLKSVLEEAKKRNMLPNNFQSETIDVQPLDTTKQQLIVNTGSKPVDEEDLPDILS